MKILFVDDERLIRESMKTLIDWERVGCTQLEMADSAAHAIELMQSTAFDLVISDIVMQRMNGIELSKYIRTHFPETKVIILSAHEDFSMARGAIEAGVSQYLLKPIVPEELEQAIRQAGEEIFERQRKHDEVLETEKIVDLYRHVVTEGIWRELLSPAAKDSTRISSMLEVSGLARFEGRAACVLVSCGDVDEQEAHRLALGSLSTIMGSAKTEEKEYALVISEGSSAQELEQLRSRFSAANGTDALVVCGYFVDDLLLLKNSYADAKRKQMLYAALSLDSPVLQYEYERELKNDEKLEYLFRDLKVAFVYGGKSLPRKLDTFYACVLKYPGEKARGLLEARLLLELYTQLKEKGAELPAYELLMKQYAAIPQMDERKQMIAQMAAHYVTDVAGNENRPQVLAENIKRYIDENYSDPDLSVRSIADSFFISNAYLSRIFKRTFGQTCIEYITKVRLDYACRLLENAEIRVADIAEKAGYSTAYYFSVQFKKVIGETPVEYRRRVRKANESDVYP